MSVNDELGKRMKEFYEGIPKIKLMRRTPVAVRLDGKSFHTFTYNFNKPFDHLLIQAMQETMKFLCENIQGCVFGYTQSDEITLILVDYKKINSSAWFDYEVQKITSIAASMATMKFNQVFSKLVKDEGNTFEAESRKKCRDMTKEEYEAWWNSKIMPIYAHDNSAETGAMFDARCFNIPKEEVCNLIYWRQLDATRNSIQMVGQANFPHKELQNKSCNDIQDMLFVKKGINWNDFPVYLKRGTACYKTEDIEYTEKQLEGFRLGLPFKSVWIIDKNMPILKGEDRIYVDKWIYYPEGE